VAELNWTDAQWQKINDAVTEAFGKASVAAAFLPMYGPLTGSAEIVRNERLLEHGTTISLDKDHAAVNLKLVNLTVKVKLSSEQIADEALSNALLAFRRAANILALEQDLVVFAGYARGFPDENSTFVTNQAGPHKGLADLPARSTFDLLGSPASMDALGQSVVGATVRAMNTLETASNPSPFACVLGNNLYEAVHNPSSSMVLPADRMTPMLRGGLLLRSGKIDADTGIVVSLGGSVVDLVIGAPPTVQFLQRDEDAKFLFRVYMRFALRIRDNVRPPVAGFRVADAARIALEGTQLRELR